MAPEKRPSFDADGPGVRALLRISRACKPTEAVVSKPFLQVAGERAKLHGEQHKIGVRLTLPEHEADGLIAIGVVRRFAAPS